MNDTIQTVKELLSQSVVGEIMIHSDTKLHHYGSFNTQKDALDKPIWVSDEHAVSQAYENFGVKAAYYTTTNTNADLKLANLEGVSLVNMCMKVGVSSHAKWNLVLAGALEQLGYDGLIYSNREILVCKPCNSFNNVVSTSL
ncbi:TPA: hypothetical protein NJ508_004518 [Vibrio parahaemolyticus]|uniref:hypothetical protein n=1 Tax=Vibrio sp. 1637 TaxID=3074569 RepID=UPI002965603D|nr:hypothetical protein [Vibrio sp. 1637]MDW2175899.1 hypothetical protein [Vibrio sp. 1637]HCG8133038.1 hypothetical protein [Vibrio parahaemolyticus]